ncbi:hypothetical protein Tco_0720660, partial [Tanacetum coccineum]
RPKRKDTKIPQSSGPTDNVINEAVNEEMDDSGGPKRQDTMGDTIAQTRSENVSKLSNDTLLSRGNILRSGEDIMQLNELMELCTTLQSRVLTLENTKTTQAAEISNEDLGDQEDASKQGRIGNIDAHEDIYLVNVHRDKDIFGLNDQDDDIMFDMSDLAGEEVFVESEVVAKKKDDVVNVVKEVVNVVTTSTRATTTGILLQEPSESITTTTIPLKDKGKGIMVEEPLKMKKKDRVLFDEQEAIRLQAQFDEEERIVREKEEANAALIAQWNDIQDKVETDYELAQSKKETLCYKKSRRKEEYTTYKSSTKEHHVYLPEEYGRMEAQRLKEQKKRGIDNLQELNKGASCSEVRAEGSEIREESSSKRARDELEQEKAKKQKMNDEQETVELQSLIEIVSDEEGIAIDAIPLATKPSSIVDWKVLKEGKISYYQIIRADGSSKRYSAIIQMLRSFDREDLETLWKLIKAKHGSTRPEEGYKRGRIVGIKRLLNAVGVTAALMDINDAQSKLVMLRKIILNV